MALLSVRYIFTFKVASEPWWCPSGASLVFSTRLQSSEINSKHKKMEGAVCRESVIGEQLKQIWNATKCAYSTLQWYKDYKIPWCL